MDTARLLLRTGDSIDFNLDGLSDGTVVEIFHSFTTTVGLSLGNHGVVHVDVSYNDGVGVRRSLMRIGTGSLLHDGFEAPSAALAVNE